MTEADSVIPALPSTAPAGVASRPRSRLKSAVWLLVVLLAGVAAGGWLFADTQPRALIGIGQCNADCYRVSDIMGLAASVGIQRFPKAVPLVVSESGQCIAIRNPYSPHRIHFVLFPKRDIRNIAQITAADGPYVMGCMSMLGALVSQYHLKAYRVYSNGPVEQDISYLHFHLVAD